MPAAVRVPISAVISVACLCERWGSRCIPRLVEVTRGTTTFRSSWPTTGRENKHLLIILARYIAKSSVLGHARNPTAQCLHLPIRFVMRWCPRILHFHQQLARAEMSWQRLGRFVSSHFFSLFYHTQSECGGFFVLLAETNRHAYLNIAVHSVLNTTSLATRAASQRGVEAIRKSAAALGTNAGWRRQVSFSQCRRQLEAARRRIYCQHHNGRHPRQAPCASFVRCSLSGMKIQRAAHMEQPRTPQRMMDQSAA